MFVSRRIDYGVFRVRPFAIMMAISFSGHIVIYGDLIERRINGNLEGLTQTFRT